MGSSEPMLLLWYMYHGATRAFPAEKIAPVKWVAVTEIWYKQAIVVQSGIFKLIFRSSILLQIYRTGRSDV